MAVRGSAGHRLVDQPAGVGRDGQIHFFERRHVFLRLAQGVRGHSFLAAWRRAAECVIERGAEGIDVRAEILLCAIHAFRRDVVGRGPKLRGARLAALRDQREAEVHQLGVALGIQQDVAGFHVAVDQAGDFRGLETTRHFNGQREHLGFGNFPEVMDALFQMAAGHHLHGDVKAPVRAAGGEHTHHMRVAERGGQPGLLLECRDAPLVRGVILVEDLERHFAAERLILRRKHHAHAAHRMPAQQPVGSEAALHPRLHAAMRAHDHSERSQRRNVHPRPAGVAGFAVFRRHLHARRLKRQSPGIQGPAPGSCSRPAIIRDSLPARDAPRSAA
jgi:hypothetical protein